MHRHHPEKCISEWGICDVDSLSGEFVYVSWPIILYVHIRNSPLLGGLGRSAMGDVVLYGFVCFVFYETRLRFHRYVYILVFVYFCQGFVLVVCSQLVWFCLLRWFGLVSVVYSHTHIYTKLLFNTSIYLICRYRSRCYGREGVSTLANITRCAFFSIGVGRQW